MLIFGFQANDFGKWLKELVSWVDNELEVELSQYISFFFKDLSCSILISTAQY